MPINACWLHSARVAPLTKLKELTVNTRRPPFKVPLEASIVCVALLATLMARGAPLIPLNVVESVFRLLSVLCTIALLPLTVPVTVVLLSCCWPGPRQRIRAVG